MKQRSNCLHFDPAQSSERASILRPGGAFFGQRADLGAVADFGGLFPVLDDLEIGDLFEAGENRGVFGVVNLLAAGVVAAAFHVADAQGAADDLFEERNVAEEELFLQGFGAGGDDDALFGKQRGDEISQRFAGSGAGFDDQLAAFVESAFDGERHLHLTGTRLEGGVRGGQRAAGQEEAFVSGLAPRLVQLASSWRS